MKINHYQEPTFDGFGDILNLLSFENYVINEHVDILYHYDETRTSFVNYIVNDFFIPKQNINRILKPYKANNFKTDYRLINHDYWPSKINNKTGLKGKDLFMPLRLVLTGKSHGPELKHLLPLFNKN